MLKRYLSDFIKESILDFPAVLIVGARQVGKSTLAKQLVQERICQEYVSFDDLSAWQLASADPDGFLERFQGSVALDEVQRVPDLMRAIKKRIDENRQPGKFLLTGSANILALPQVSESLAGRVDIFHLEGLSLGEILQQAKRPRFAEHLFESTLTTDLSASYQRQRQDMPVLTRQFLDSCIFFGGFPGVYVKNSPQFARRWFSAYQKTYIERDVRDVSKSVDVIPFAKLLELMALWTGNLQVISNLAGDVGVDQRTISRYLGLFELTFQTNRLVPWFANVSKSLIKTPKIYMNDSGTACFYHQLKNAESLGKTKRLGGLAETWLWAELRKQLVFMPGVVPNFYRTEQKKEVDFVLSSGTQIRGIECKWSKSVGPADFEGLKDLQEVAGPDFLGVILYLGDEVITFGKNLLAIPIQALLMS